MQIPLATSSGSASARQSTTAEICAASSSAGQNLHDPETQAGWLHFLPVQCEFACFTLSFTLITCIYIQHISYCIFYCAWLIFALQMDDDADDRK